MSPPCERKCQRPGVLCVGISVLVQNRLLKLHLHVVLELCATTLDRLDDESADGSYTRSCDRRSENDPSHGRSPDLVHDRSPRRNARDQQRAVWRAACAAPFEEMWGGAVTARGVP